MAEAIALWDLLRQTADPDAVAALKTAVDSDADRAVNRINPLAFAAARGLDEEAVIGSLVHAARLGLFDMSWNMLCPGCGGVLETSAALKTLNRDQYFCSLCVAENEPTLDQLIEVTFTVNPRVRRIAAHDPRRASARRIHAPDLLGLRRRRSGRRRERDRKGDARRHGASARREGGDVADAAEGLCHRLRSGHPFDAFPRGCGRGDARAAQPVRRSRRHERPFRLDKASAGPSARLLREQVGPADAAGPLGA